MRHKLTTKVLKTIGLFSGAESLKIICSVVKMKLVALWLGATGVGLFGIFNSSLETISILTGLGLRESGVRAVARNRDNAGMLKRMAASLRGWCAMSGAIGALIVCALAPWLSLFFFKDYGYWWQFMILAAALLFNSLANGEQAILQGTDTLKSLAKAAAAGSLVGLALSIPMFRYMGDESVVFSILVYSLSILFFLYIFRRRDIAYKIPDRGEIKDGKPFVKLGGYMAVASFATSLAQMLFMSWLNRDASTAEVGYFQAGNALVFRYTSLIFGAVGLEFYPRMAAQNGSAHRMSVFVSHEIGLLLKIFTPLLVMFLICRRWIVQLLYSSDFEVILPFISIAIFTVVLRSVSACMAYCIIAKGDGKTYLLTESLDAVFGLILNIVLYRVWGLLGLGVAQVLWYAIYSLMIGSVYFGRYRMKLTDGATKGIVFYSSVCAVACLIAALI